MIKDKVKALFMFTGVSQTAIADKLGLTKQHLNNNINQRNIKAKDLIEYAALTGTQLAFIDKSGKPIVTFDTSDIEA